MTPEEFQKFANSQGRGYLKAWKANSILRTLDDIPGILGDHERLYQYLQNCLEMEGFSPNGIELITIELRRQKGKSS